MIISFFDLLLFVILQAVNSSWVLCLVWFSLVRKRREAAINDQNYIHFCLSTRFQFSPLCLIHSQLLGLVLGLVGTFLWFSLEWTVWLRPSLGAFAQRRNVRALTTIFSCSSKLCWFSWNKWRWTTRLFFFFLLLVQRIKATTISQIQAPPPCSRNISWSLCGGERRYPGRGRKDGRYDGSLKNEPKIIVTAPGGWYSS